MRYPIQASVAIEPGVTSRPTGKLRCGAARQPLLLPAAHHPDKYGFSGAQQKPNASVRHMNTPHRLLAAGSSAVLSTRDMVKVNNTSPPDSPISATILANRSQQSLANAGPVQQPSSGTAALCYGEELRQLKENLRYAVETYQQAEWLHQQTLEKLVDSERQKDELGLWLIAMHSDFSIHAEAAGQFIAELQQYVWHLEHVNAACAQDVDHMVHETNILHEQHTAFTQTFGCLLDNIAQLNELKVSLEAEHGQVSAENEALRVNLGAIWCEANRQAQWIRMQESRINELHAVLEQEFALRQDIEAALLQVAAGSNLKPTWECHKHA